MSLFSIDEQKCKRDGFCVSDCPAAIIMQKGNESCPEPVSGAEDMCIECGHCVAVCPHDAFNHHKVPFDLSPPIAEENSITQEQAVQFLRSRRSIRHFEDRSPDKKTIQTLIETARYAPTGGNIQSVTRSVYSEKADVKKMAALIADWMRSAVENSSHEMITSYFPVMLAAWDAGMDVILRDAPVLVVASAPGESINGMVDVSIMLAYLELAAIPMRLGTCWSGLGQMALLESRPLQKFIGLPASHKSHFPMMLGYPKYRYHRMPERKPPRIFWK